MTIKLSDISTSLGTRSCGQQIRKSVEAHLEAGGSVIFDFSNITSVSHSFADECFGKMLDKWDLDSLKKITSFKNTSSIVSSVILTAFNVRLSEPLIG